MVKTQISGLNLFANRMTGRKTAEQQSVEKKIHIISKPGC
jgi:hypothetical protein